MSRRGSDAPPPVRLCLACSADAVGAEPGEFVIVEPYECDGCRDAEPD